LGEKTQMNRKLKLAFAAALLISLLMVASVYAVLKYTGTVSNTVNVKGYEVQLWRTDTGVTVTSFAWGDIVTGSTQDTETLLSVSKKLCFKNTGDLTEYIAWKANGTLPSGLTLTADVWTGSAWTAWAQNVYSPDIGSIGAGQIGSVPVRFTLSIADGSARGATSFVIDLLAATTQSG